MDKICDMDLTGQVFGKLTAIELHKKENGYAFWKCKCECGKEIITRANSLIKKQTTSCGCYRSERGRKMLIKMNYKHGLHKSRLYSIRRNMLQRCYNPKAKRYKFYGEKGIQVCNEWRNSFIEFYNWAIKNGYDENLTIDRIDVDGDYSPSNCRWATTLQQNKNTSRTIFVNFNNQKMCLKDASKASGISYTSLRYRYKKGLRGKELFNTYKYRKGELKCLNQILQANA